MCDLGDIFKSKVDKLLGDIKFVKKYINDILVLFKEILSNLLDQLRVVLAIMITAVLKLKCLKYSLS